MKTMSTTHRLAYLLAMTAALAGCGGGTEKSTPPAPAPAPAPAPTGIVSLSFMTDAQANVFERGSSNNSLNIQAILDGSNASGLPVMFSASSGTLSPVQVNTNNSGLAATVLSIPAATPTGSARITATATANNTAVSTFTAYVRPVPNKLELLIPAYFSASSNAAAWTMLTDGATSYPDVALNIIVKPDNATSGTMNAAITKTDDKLSAAITTLKTAQPKAKVFGYVATGGGANAGISSTDVTVTIDKYIALYPKQLDGIFLDGMATDDSRKAFFQTIYAYASGKGLKVIGNPGAYPAANYAGLADMLVTYTGPATSYQSANPQPANAWVYNQQNTTQGMLVHTASTCSDMQGLVTDANRPRMNTGLVYVTDQSIGSPWSALPSYWKNLLGTVDATNKGVARPVC